MKRASEKVFREGESKQMKGTFQGGEQKQV